MWVRMNTMRYIKFFNLCHVRHIRNVYMCGIEQELREFKIIALTSISLIDDLNSPY